MSQKFQSSVGGGLQHAFFLRMAARPQLPGIARPRLPGIACSLPSPRQGRDSSYRGRDSDFALHRGSDFAVASDFARKILRKRCGGERIASGVGFHPENPITGPAPKVCQRCCPRSIADRVFFHHSHALPSILLWQQDCPFNPAVATGLLHPILPWQQDCPFNPAVATGLLHPILLWQQDCPFNPAVATGLLHPFLCWQQDCPGALRAARAWNCSCPSTGL